MRGVVDTVDGKASENGRSSQAKKINRATYTVAFLFEDRDMRVGLMGYAILSALASNNAWNIRPEFLMTTGFPVGGRVTGKAKERREAKKRRNAKRRG